MVPRKFGEISTSVPTPIVDALYYLLFDYVGMNTKIMCAKIKSKLTSILAMTQVIMSLCIKP